MTDLVLTSPKAPTRALSSRMPPAPIPEGLQPILIAVRHVAPVVVDQACLDLRGDDVPEPIDGHGHLRFGHGPAFTQLPFADAAGQWLDVGGAHGVKDSTMEMCR